MPILLVILPTITAYGQEPVQQQMAPVQNLGPPIDLRGSWQMYTYTNKESDT